MAAGAACCRGAAEEAAAPPPGEVPLEAGTEGSGGEATGAAPIREEREAHYRAFVCYYQQHAICHLSTWVLRSPAQVPLRRLPRTRRRASSPAAVAVSLGAFPAGDPELRRRRRRWPRRAAGLHQRLPGGPAGGAAGESPPGPGPRLRRKRGGLETFDKR